MEVRKKWLRTRKWTWSMSEGIFWMSIMPWESAGEKYPLTATFIKFYKLRPQPRSIRTTFSTMDKSIESYWYREGKREKWKICNIVVKFNACDSCLLFLKTNNLLRVKIGLYVTLKYYHRS